MTTALAAALEADLSGWDVVAWTALFAVLTFLLRVVWVGFLDPHTVVLPFRGVRALLADWRGFLLVGAAWHFLPAAGARLKGSLEGIRVGLIPGAWLEMLLITAAVAAAAVLLLEAMRGVWFGHGGFHQVGDWIRNPLARVPELLGTVTASLAILWVWNFVVSGIQGLSLPVDPVRAEALLRWPSVGLVSGGPGPFFLGVAAMLLFVLPALLVVLHAQGDEDDVSTAFLGALRRYVPLVKEWRTNLSWTMGVVLLWWAWGGLDTWLDTLAGFGLLGDLVRGGQFVLGLAVRLGGFVSLFGLVEIQARRVGSSAKG